MNYYEGTGKETADRIELIKTCIWGFAFTAFWLFILIYGLAWLSSVTVTAEDIYVRRVMYNRIKTLEKLAILNEDHTHRYYDGKIR